MLRLSPDAFWRMTPRELALALGVALPPALPPMRRNELSALSLRFPDETAQRARSQRKE